MIFESRYQVFLKLMIIFLHIQPAASKRVKRAAAPKDIATTLDTQPPPSQLGPHNASVSIYIFLFSISYQHI